MTDIFLNLSKSIKNQVILTNDKICVTFYKEAEELSVKDVSTHSDMIGA